MPKKINIKTIAAELGVSPSTVSKALKDSHEIGEKTRQKIQAFAKQYRYKPNSLALSLRNQKTMVLGVIIPQITHHFFTRVISGIEYVANQQDYNLMICLSKNRYEKEIETIEMLTNGSVDGLLISLAKETMEKGDYKHFEHLLEEDFPLVFFDRVPPGLNVDKVVIDDEEGGYKAAKTLIDKGRKRPALISTPDHITVGLEREKGFKKALQDAGLTYYPHRHIKVDEKQDIEMQISKLFVVQPLPDAIFAVNETYAAIAMKLALKNGLNIPKDIAIIGFTDGMISKLTIPSMTTVAQHGYSMGNKAAELVLNKINKKSDDDSVSEQDDTGRSPNQTVVISTNVVEREST
ncbi:MAG: LacI family transcriptional regulator [Flavobacteriales bacterium]|nr:MAG: LacI family transcriptional regulator [Flavobacteriales bacterium]